jgi:predicted permease
VTHGKLPPEIESLIAEVMRSARLDFVQGREEVLDDLRVHFEDGLAAGESPEDLIARFGDPIAAGRRIAKTRPKAAAKRRGKTGRWWMSTGEWSGEARRAGRRLRRAPGFAAIVILTLGLGVGANTAIFTVLNAVLLQDLPYPLPERLVRVYESYPENPFGSEYLRAPTVSEIRTWDEVFESFGSLYTYREVGADLTDGDVPQRITIGRVSAGYFETMGVQPALGRGFLEEESFGPGEHVNSVLPIVPVAVLSHRLWVERFESDTEIIGRSLHLDGVPFEVVGVMPPRFNNPLGTPSDLWVPQDLRPGGWNGFGNSYLTGLARLRDGVSIEAAQERVRVLADAFTEEYPDARDAYPRLVPLQDDVVGATRRAMLWILAGAAGLVLLTACVNVANLLFARGLGQDRELALRSALGSGRARLVATILLENGILAGLGGLLGLALGWAGVEILVALSPAVLPTAMDVEVGAQVFVFALAVTGVALIAFGLAPALRLSRTAPAEVLRSGDRSATAGRMLKRLRDSLVVVQLAAAVVLVAGAALLTRSFDSLTEVPLGVDPEGVLTFEVHLPSARYADGESRHRFHEEFQARVSALGSVESVGATSWLPVSGRYHSWTLYYDPENPEGGNDEAWYPADVRIIAGDYFGTMGIALLQGADPTEVDLEAEPMVWVNQPLVDEILVGIDPIGIKIYAVGEYRRIMGVVEDVPHTARGETSAKTYVPHAQYADNRNWALIQTAKVRGDLAATRERIRDELRAMDPQLVLYRPKSFDTVLETVRAQDRFATVLMGSFAALALVLALVGTYGVLAGSVTGRKREIGIRMALGADARRVRGMVLGYAARLTLPGVLLGLSAAMVGSRWIESLLFGVDAADPVAFGGAVLTFIAVGLLSAWIPARRATRVDTVQTLTGE